MDSLLSFKNVYYSYHTLAGEVPVLSDISFDIYKGNFISIVGPSGCGKSTLLSLICDLLSPDSGKIIKAPNLLIGYMFQKDNLFEWRTVYENAILGLEIKKMLNETSIADVNSMLKEYNLYNFRNSYPRELSGGMRQRVALIRTLAVKPDICLLDEPFSALDYQTRLEVSDDIGKILKEHHKTAILVTHDIAEAISMSEKIMILSKRPASIRKILDVDINLSNKNPFNARFSEGFNDLFNLIWKELSI